MNIQSVALFGGSGKIGRRFIAVLQERGIRIRALIHRTPLEGEGIECISGSVSDPAAVREVVSGTDAVLQLAQEHKPKIIIAGYSSYPWVPDWKKFREIADAVGAILLADVSHIAGLIAAQVVPSPVGIAHVVTFTTHKTLCGPLGSCILTTDSAMAKKIDRAVFPGEQGGPHVHAIAALAVALKIAQSESFRQLQAQIVKNCQALTRRLQERGLRIPFGGSDTHLGNVDCKSIVGEDGTPLSGDMAARILDIAGIVLNRNTIPGDKSALNASGIRYGTPWMTQRGLKEEDMVEVADIIADILFATKPYSIETRQGMAPRAKVDFEVFENARLRVRALAEKASTDLTAVGGAQERGSQHRSYRWETRLSAFLLRR